jgi:hypothetical protein
MSRVGVRTLLTWHRARSLHYELSAVTGLKWRYGINLYVRLSRTDYSIHYDSWDYDFDIDLMRCYRGDILLIYRDITGDYYLSYRDGGLIENKISLTYSLLKIPVTNIFDMFPTIVNTITNYYKNKNNADI